MKRHLYLEAKSGIAGDMVVGALLDLGADFKKVAAALKSMHIDGLDFDVRNVVKSGIAAKDFRATMHGLTDEEEIRAHHHEHDHYHSHHEHRALKDVFDVLEKADMTLNAKKTAKKIFTIVAQAESKVHGKPVEHIHFHEVGAWDSIADIAAAAVCFDDLNISDVYVSDLYEGSGFVDCAHGTLPVPVPATARIAADCDMGLVITPAPYEQVTPTGIAIAAALRTKKGVPKGKIIKVGYGAGKRETQSPNVLRAFLMNEEENAQDIWVIETNIDDSTGEQLGFALEKLMQNGAKDAHYIPCLMKKGRPAWLLRIVAAEADLERLEKNVFEMTSSIGLRKFKVERTCMDREIIKTVLPCGTVSVKKCSFGDIVRYYPEYESVRSVADAAEMDFSTVFDMAKNQAKNG